MNGQFNVIRKDAFSHQYLNSIFQSFKPADQNKYFTNSVDPDEIEMAHNVQSHQDLHCLPSCFDFFMETPLWNNGSDRSQRWKSPLQ